MSTATLHRSRRRVRGVTLVEVLIVVAIIALVSTGVGLAAVAYWEKARNKTAATNARNLRAVVKLWLTEHDDSACPDVEALARDQVLDRDSPRLDPWGKPWHIECVEHDAVILSDGHDRLPGTADDIRIPPT